MNLELKELQIRGEYLAISEVTIKIKQNKNLSSKKNQYYLAFQYKGKGGNHQAILVTQRGKIRYFLNFEQILKVLSSIQPLKTLDFIFIEDDKGYWVEKIEGKQAQKRLSLLN